MSTRKNSATHPMPSIHARVTVPKEIKSVSDAADWLATWYPTMTGPTFARILSRRFNVPEMAFYHLYRCRYIEALNNVVLIKDPESFADYFAGQLERGLEDLDALCNAVQFYWPGMDRKTTITIFKAVLGHSINAN